MHRPALDVTRGTFQDNVCASRSRKRASAIQPFRGSKNKRQASLQCGAKMPPPQQQQQRSARHARGGGGLRLKKRHNCRGSALWKDTHTKDDHPYHLFASLNTIPSDFYLFFVHYFFLFSLFSFSALGINIAKVQSTQSKLLPFVFPFLLL